jgi:hypothetical protein
MRIRAVSFALAVAALLGATQVTSAQSGYPYRYYGWRECWVTMSGLGVCAPRPYVRRRRHHRAIDAPAARRHRGHFRQLDLADEASWITAHPLSGAEFP